MSKNDDLTIKEEDVVSEEYIRQEGHDYFRNMPEVELCKLVYELAGCKVVTVEEAIPSDEEIDIGSSSFQTVDLYVVQNKRGINIGRAGIDEDEAWSELTLSIGGAFRLISGMCIQRKAQLTVAIDERGVFATIASESESVYEQVYYADAEQIARCIAEAYCAFDRSVKNQNKH